MNNKNLKRLYIFDFDDTLVKSNSRVFLRNKRLGYEEIMSPAKFAVYTQQPDDIFDFSEFDKVIDPFPFINNLKRFHYVISKRYDAIVLTARDKPSRINIKNFLLEYDIIPTDIITLGNGNPLAKSNYISSLLSDGTYDYVEYYDDSIKNINAVENIKKRFPAVKFKLYHIVEGVPIDTASLHEMVRFFICESKS